MGGEEHDEHSCEGFKVCQRVINENIKKVSRCERRRWKRQSEGKET